MRTIGIVISASSSLLSNLTVEGDLIAGSTSTQLFIDAGGNLGIGTTTADNLLTIVGSADQIQLLVQANSSQTTDIFTVEKSDGTDYFHIEGSGEVHIIHIADHNDDRTLEIDTNAAAFGDVKAIDINYVSGAISAGEDEGIVLINIDELAATGGEIFGFEVLSTEGSAEVFGFKVGAGVGAVHQDSGVFVDPTTGTDNTTSIDVAFMIDGNSASTTDIFENDNEYILIGAATAFEEIEIVLTTVASGGGIAPTFAYSISGAHTFTTFSPVDGTNGFRNTGIIAWDASDLVSHTTNSNTGTFDILITRTRNSLATTPILGYAKIAATTEYIWDKNGDLKVRNSTSTDYFNVGANALLINSSGIIEKGIWNGTKIDISDYTNLTAGRSLTMSGDSVEADAELYVFKAKIAFEDPIATDDFFFEEIATTVTFTSIYCKTLVGTVDLDITIAGTDINGTDITCTTSGVLDSSLGGDTAGAIGEELKLAITSVASSPTYILVQINGTYDD